MLGVGSATALVADHALGRDRPHRPRLRHAVAQPRLDARRCRTALISHGSSTINFLRQLGGAVGISLVGIVLEWRLRRTPARAAARVPRDLRADRRDHRLRDRRGLAHGARPRAAVADGRGRSLATAMNLDSRPLPERCDVARRRRRPGRQRRRRRRSRAPGVDVVLVDQHAFPRDKVCGDGLIPDAHHALRRLGVLDEVMAAGAGRATHVGCIGPRGGRIDVPGRARRAAAPQLDDILLPRRGRGRRAHVRAGALRGAARGRDGRVVGARLQHGDARRARCARRWVVLATGARAAGADRRRHVRAAHAERHRAARLRAATRRWSAASRRSRSSGTARCAPGYGWIFPCPRRRLQHRRRHRRTATRGARRHARR